MKAALFSMKKDECKAYSHPPSSLLPLPFYFCLSSVSFSLTAKPVVYLIFVRVAAEFAAQALAREVSLFAREVLQRVIPARVSLFVARVCVRVRRLGRIHYAFCPPHTIDAVSADGRPSAPRLARVLRHPRAADSSPREKR